METVTPTISAAHLQTCKLMNKPFTVLPNSTLNQKFNLFPEETVGTNEYPSLGYLAIGNKGATYEIAPGGFLLTDPIPHLPHHASPYNMIPFVVRPADDDLTASERMKYRMRVPMTTTGGQNIVAYYLMPLDLTNTTPQVEIRNVNDGVITTAPFVHALSDLNPAHPVISNVDLNNPNGDYLVSTAKTVFTLDQGQISNIMEACNILYGDPRYAVINEVALVTGKDKVLQGIFGGIATNYTEVVVAQVAAFIAQSHVLTASTREVTIGLNVGSVEPLAV